MAAASDSARPPIEVGEVADMYDQMASANVEFSRQLDLIAAAPHPLSQVTVDALARLLAVVQPAAAARARLAVVPAPLLMAGIREWARRQPHLDAARVRAARVWHLEGQR